MRHIGRPYRQGVKTRWRNHQMSLKDKSKGNDTGQSKHQWRLKDLKKDFAIPLKILAKAKSYNNKKKTMLPMQYRKILHFI